MAPIGWHFYSPHHDANVGKVFGDLGIVVDEEQRAADQLVGGEEGGADATVLDQLQTVQVHVLQVLQMVHLDEPWICCETCDVWIDGDIFVSKLTYPITTVANEVAEDL